MAGTFVWRGGAWSRAPSQIRTLAARPELALAAEHLVSVLGARPGIWAFDPFGDGRRTHGLLTGWLYSRIDVIPSAEGISVGLLEVAASLAALHHRRGLPLVALVRMGQEIARGAPIFGSNLSTKLACRVADRLVEQELVDRVETLSCLGQVVDDHSPDELRAVLLARPEPR